MAENLALERVRINAKNAGLKTRRKNKTIKGLIPLIRSHDKPGAKSARKLTSWGRIKAIYIIALKGQLSPLTIILCHT